MAELRDAPTGFARLRPAVPVEPQVEAKKPKMDAQGRAYAAIPSTTVLVRFPSSIGISFSNRDLGLVLRAAFIRVHSFPERALSHWCGRSIRSCWTDATALGDDPTLAD